MKKQNPAKLKTRPDLSDQEWLAMLAASPENRGIDVRALHRRLFEWCDEKGVTPTRLRLLRWLDNEREGLPMTLEPPYGRPSIREGTAKPSEPSYKCRTCFDTGEKTVFPNPNSMKGSHTAPCPDCQ